MSDPLLNSNQTSSSASPAPSGSEGGFDPKIILHILLKRLWLLFAITISIPTMVWIYARKLPRQYQSTATMVVDFVTPQYMGQQFREVVDVETTNWISVKEYLDTQYQIIRSRSVALRVAQNLCRKLEDSRSSSLASGFRLLFGLAHCKAPGTAERIAPLLPGMLTLNTTTRDSRVVNVTVDTLHPEVAALVANTYVETYIQRNVDQRQGASGRATNWLNYEYQTLAKQLTDAETSLVEFKKKKNILKVSIEDQRNGVVAQMQRFQDELQNVRLRLVGLRSIREQYAKLAQDEDPSQSVPPPMPDQHNGNVVFQELRRQYLDIIQKKVELSGRYLEKNPQVIAQDARLRTLHDEMKKELRLAEKTVSAQFNALVQQEQELRRNVDSLTSEILALEEDAIKYNTLKREYDRLRQLTDRVGGRETEAGLASRLNTNNVQLLDPAQVPSGPVGPNVRAAVFTSIAISLLLSIFLCFFIEFLDSTVKTQDDVERVIGVPFLGMIPHLPDTSKETSPDAPPEQKDLFIARHPKSTIAECCRVIRTNLLFMTPDRPPRAILVTSAGPQEGKSMSSVSLALTMAQSGTRVLLVDTDMRRPRLHKVFGIPSGGIGITTVIAGTAAPLEAVRNTPYENLFLLPCGPLPPNPAELLQAERFRHLVGELCQSFDKVIFDSPPIGAVTDPLVLSQVTDGVILVVKSHKTSRDILRRATRQLRDLGAKMLGCVLNDLDLEGRRKGYGYPYYYYYRSGYYRYGYYASDEDGQNLTDAKSAAPEESKPEGVA